MTKRQPNLKGTNVRRRVSPTGVVRFEARYVQGGRERQRSFRTPEAALKFQAERKADVLRGLARDEDKASRPFRAYAAQWLEQKASEARPVTVQGYADLLERYALPYFSDLKVGRTTSATCLDYLRQLSARRTTQGYGLSPATIKHAYTPVAQVLALALVDGAIHTNPALGLRLPSRNAAPRAMPFRAQPLTAEDVNVLCSALDERDPTGMDSLVVCFLANTGLRAAEVAGLELRDYNPLRKTIRVERTKTLAGKPRVLVTAEPKSTTSTRTIPVPGWLADDLDAYLLTHPRRTEPTAPLFPARIRAQLAQPPITSNRPNPRADLSTAFDWHAPIEPGTFLQRRFRPSLEAAATTNPDLPTTVRLHDLRHSYGTNLRIAGRALDEISRLVGHASLAITHELYVHDDPSRFTDAVNVLADPRADRRPTAPTALVAG